MAVELLWYEDIIGDDKTEMDNDYCFGIIDTYYTEYFVHSKDHFLQSLRLESVYKNNN